MHTRFAQTCHVFALDIAIPVRFFVHAPLCEPHIVHNQGVHHLHSVFSLYNAIRTCVCLFVCPVILSFISSFGSDSVVFASLHSRCRARSLARLLLATWVFVGLASGGVLMLPRAVA